MSPQLHGAVIEKNIYKGNTNSLVSKSKLSFYSTQLSTKERVLVLNNKIDSDYITGITNQSSLVYDSFYNVSSRIDVIGDRTKELITNYEYSNNPQGTGHQYHMGRVISTQSLEKYDYNSDSRNSEEIFSYDNNLLIEIKRRGHNTDYISEKNKYDIFGNIVEVEISSDDLPVQKLKNVYDSNGRFVVKKTDIDGLETLISYNALGQVMNELSPLGANMTNEYDNWGKLLKTTISGTSSVPLVTNYSYNRLPSGGWTIIKSNVQVKSYSEEMFDVFGNLIQTTVRGFSQGSLIHKRTNYDIIGRKIKESEPFVGNNPTLWTNIIYDDLSRPIKLTNPSGRETLIEYSGSIVTTNDDGKIKKVINNALGDPTRVIDNGQNIDYEYYANGSIKSISYGTHIVTFTIDGWGRKLSMLDPSISSLPFTYTYNNYGEILKETTPTSSTTYTYNEKGKLIKKHTIGNDTNVLVNYLYNSVGLVTRVFGSSNGISEDFTNNYDVYNRIFNTVESYSNSKYSVNKTYEYDSFGRVEKEKTITSSSEGIQSIAYITNVFNTYNGLLEQILDSNTNKLIWRTSSTNLRMQVTSGQYGNGIFVSNTYDNYGNNTNIRHTKTGSTDILSLDYDYNVRKGLLNSRKNNSYNWIENFTYDSFERLISWSNPNGVETNNYQDDGRISENSKVGNYYYDNVSKYKLESLDLNTNGSSHYNQRELQQIRYNSLKRPIHISEQNRGSLFFNYGINGGRSEMFEKGTVTEDLNSPNLRKKFYNADGSVEIVIKGDDENATGSNAKIITYIGGDAYTAAAIFVTEYSDQSPKTDSYYYLHRDYQGTIMAISDQSGNLKERRHFDPWGILVKFTNSSGAVLNTPDLLSNEFFIDRGYTGHEHLFRVGLIHMNARLYDPILKSFLSPDNFVQDSQNSQNLNRYAYCLNNPLKYTDPSGEVIIAGSAVLGAAVVGALIGGVVYTGLNLYYGTFSWNGLIKSTLLGAVSGVVAYGVGDLIATTFPVVSSGTGTAIQEIGVAMYQAGAHGITQGMIAGISGGNFSTAFFSGALGSIGAGLFSIGMKSVNLGKSSKAIGTLLFGTASGGVGAKLTGGNFWEGASIGLAVGLLNHLAHSFNQNDPEKRLTVEQQKKLQNIKSGTELTIDLIEDLGLDTILDDAIAKTALGKVLKVGVLDYISMGGEIIYDYKLHKYGGINRYEVQFRFVSNTSVGLITAHFSSLTTTAIGAKYGSTFGGIAGSVVGIGLGFWIDSTYIQGIRYVDKFFRDFGTNLQNQVIFNISNSR